MSHHNAKEIQMDTNRITLVGKMTSEFQYSHEVCSEIFYSCMISVERDSGTIDTLPVIVSERLIDVRHSYENPVCIVGSIRSHNKLCGEKKHLLVYVFASEFVEVTDNENLNELYLEATLCKQPQVRATPLGRYVADAMLVCRRTYGKYDFIPCICWGRDAMYASSMSAGDRISIRGRFQSREYIKTVNGVPTAKTAYEVSVCNVRLVTAEDYDRDENTYALHIGS